MNSVKKFFSGVGTNILTSFTSDSEERNKYLEHEHRDISNPDSVDRECLCSERVGFRDTTINPQHSESSLTSDLNLREFFDSTDRNTPKESYLGTDNCSPPLV